MEGESSSSSTVEVEEDMIAPPTVQRIKEEQKPITLWNFHGCKLCPYKTKSYFIMKSHLRRHRVTRNSKLFKCSTSIIERYKCSSCDFKTSVLVNFNKHVQVSHGKPVEIKVENSDNQDNTFVFGNFNLISSTTFLKSYSCEGCSFKTYSQLVYMKHYTKCPLNDRINGNTSFRRCNSHKEFLRWHKCHNRPRYVEFSWFQCTRCPFKAKRQTSLDGHIKARHFAPKYRFFKKVKPARRPFKVIKLHLCDDCNFTTTRIVTLRNHILANHTPIGERPLYPCKLCPYKAKWPQNLVQHVRFVHNKKRFFCEDCPFASKLKRLLDAHIMVNHRDETWGKHKTMENKSLKLVCPDCPFVTSFKSALRNHIYFKHEQGRDQDRAKCDDLFKCPDCSFVSFRRIALMNHAFFKHGQVESKEIKRCDKCNYWAVNKKKMSKHLANYHKVKLLACDQCDFKATKSRDLRGHIMEKHEVQVENEKQEVQVDKEKQEVQLQTLKCEVCIFKTTQVTDLQHHILTMHVATETIICFKCQLCTFKTVEEKELKEHVFNKHIDPQNTNWYNCEMCTNKYREQSELKKHILQNHIL